MKIDGVREPDSKPIQEPLRRMDSGGLHPIEELGYQHEILRTVNLR